MAAASTTAPPWVRLRNAQVSVTGLLRTFAMTTPPIDVQRLASRMGVDVLFDPDLECAGVLRAALDPPSAVMTIRERDAEVRRRFTIAHEIGHLLLHPIVDVVYRDDSYRGTGRPWASRESEANAFAAELLIPDFMLGPVVRAIPSVSKLASAFGVSDRAMEIRLRHAGFIR